MSQDKDSIKNNILNRGKWIRIAYMAFFALVSPLLCLILGLSTLVQIVITLIGDKPNPHLQDFGKSYGAFYRQVVEFELWASDNKPFPFDSWPSAKTKQSSSATTPRKKTPASSKDVEKKTKGTEKTTVAKRAVKKSSASKVEDDAGKKA